MTELVYFFFKRKVWDGEELPGNTHALFPLKKYFCCDATCKVVTLTTLASLTSQYAVLVLLDGFQGHISV